MAIDPKPLRRGRAAMATVRFRTAAGSVVLIAVVLVLAAAAFDLLLGRALRNSFESSLELRATDRVALLESGSTVDSIVSAIGEEEFVAVLDADGAVLDHAGLANPEDLTDVVAGVHEVRELRIFEHDGTEIELEELATYGAPMSDGGVVVVGAESYPSFEPRGAARRVLWVGIPLLVAFAAVIAWRVAGRALAPVDALRREVDDLAGSSEGVRVSESGTGDELDRLASTMNGLLNRIDEHRAEQRRFVADASHELKSPIANLRIMTETAGDVDGDSWPTMQGRLIAEADRLQALVEDLLFLARLDEQRGAGAEALVDFDDLVFTEIERTAAVADGVRLDASGVGPCQVRGSLVTMTRVVRNLVENAVRHAASRVNVSTSESGGWVTLTIDDDGPGIPAAVRDQIFERFSRLDEDRARPSGGTGLGLAIVRQVVDDRGGTVRVGDAPMGGARFEIQLPSA